MWRVNPNPTRNRDFSQTLADRARQADRPGCGKAEGWWPPILRLRFVAPFFGPSALGEPPLMHSRRDNFSLKSVCAISKYKLTTVYRLSTVGLDRRRALNRNRVLWFGRR
jgi:hypothetical protein